MASSGDPIESTVLLGPYALDRVAGRGAMATVWRGRHVDTDEPVAVKVLTGALDEHRLFHSSFRDEVRAMAGLDHPSIVGIYDHGIVPAGTAAPLPAGVPYLVMEWLDGGPLRRHRTRFGWPTLRTILLTLLDALAHAHARGVIHRDLKDTNVMLAPRGAVLTDFGLALGHEARPWDQGRGGTPAFMAPEQIRGAWRAIGPWTDLYALGCLTHALVSGEAPFTGDVHGILRAHQTETPPLLRPYDPIPSELDGWVARLLEKSPRRRFRRAADAAWALLALPDEDPETTVDDSLNVWAATVGQTSDRLTMVDPVPGSSVSDEVSSSVYGPFTSTEPTLVAPHVFLAVDDRSWSVVHPEGHSRPPCPSDWREPPRQLVPLPVELDRVLFDLRPSAMVGREVARGVLWRALISSVTDHRAGCVLVSGPPGIGKSRLATWLGERAHEVGAAQVLTAAFDAAGVGRGLRRMWIRTLRCAGLDGADRHARIATALRVEPDDELARSMSAAVDPQGRFDDGSEVRRPSVTIAKAAERWETFARALRRVSAERPVVMILDDVHHDRSALAFVQYLIDRHGDLPVLVVATLEDGAGLAGAGPLAALDQVHRVELEPVAPEAIGRMFARRLPLDRTTMLLLHDLCEGVPLHAEQRVRTWLVNGALLPTRRGHRLRHRGPLPAAISARDGWAERLERALGPWGGVQLEGAATLGLEVSPGAWAAVLDEMLDIPADDGRERLLDAGLARIDGDQRFVFVHPLVRTLILDRATRAGRDQRWHLACAAVLRRRGDPLAVAEHLLAGGRVRASVDVILELLDACRARWAVDVMGHSLRFALRAVRSLPYAPASETWCRLRAAWITHSQTEGRVEQARRHARRELALVGASGAAAAQALVQCGRTLLAADAAVAMTWFGRGLAEADRCGAIKSGIEALVMTGFCRMLTGDLSVAETTLAEGLERLEAWSPPASELVRESLEVRLYLYRAWTRWKQGRIDDAQADATAALSAAERAGSRQWQAQAETTLGDLARRRCDWGLAEAHYHAAGALLDAVGVGGPRDEACYLALVAIERGAAAEPVREEGADRTGSSDGKTRRGRPSGMSPAVAEMWRGRMRTTLELASRKQHIALVVFSSILLLCLTAPTGDVDAWARLWARLEPVTEGRITDPDVARALALAGDAAHRQGMRAQAADARRLAIVVYRALNWHERADAIAATLAD